MLKTIKFHFFWCFVSLRCYDNKFLAWLVCLFSPFRVQTIFHRVSHAARQPGAVVENFKIFHSCHLHLHLIKLSQYFYYLQPSTKRSLVYRRENFCSETPTNDRWTNFTFNFHGESRTMNMNNFFLTSFLFFTFKTIYSVYERRFFFPFTKEHTRLWLLMKIEIFRVHESSNLGILSWGRFS